MREIVLECKPDEALIKSLGYTRKMITHQPNKGQVINYLKKNPDTVGIVDEDPGSANPNYFQRFQKVRNSRFDIEYFHIESKGTRIIVIKPRLEEWIIKYATESKIDFKKHSLPDKGHQLHKIINYYLPRFEQLINQMLGKKSEALLYLKKVIDSK